MKKGYVIAIDGPSGAGKSTVAKMVAKALGYRYIDTGAMYRAAALQADRDGVDISDPDSLSGMLSRLHIRQEMSAGKVLTLLGGDDVSERIRRPDMAMKASNISALPMVRDRLLFLQREMGKAGGVVLEGRDIGTVVFPDADFKFFLTASPEERARRRFEEHKAKGEEVEFESLLEEIKKRDHNDSTREVAPLRRADDAIEIDSDGKDAVKVAREMIDAVNAAGTGV